MAVKVKSSTSIVNFEEFAGDTLEMIFTWKDSLGAIIDLTAFTARMDIRSKLSDALPQLTLTNTSGITLGNADKNLVAVVNATQTTTLGKGSYVYDIELTDTAGKVNTLIAGTITLNQSVTR